MPIIMLSVLGIGDVFRTLRAVKGVSQCFEFFSMNITGLVRADGIFIISLGEKSHYSILGHLSLFVGRLFIVLSRHILSLLNQCLCFIAFQEKCFNSHVTTNCILETSSTERQICAWPSPAIYNNLSQKSFCQCKK